MPLQDHMQIISVDDHLIEHPRVFTDRLPRKFLDQGPRIVEDDKGSHVWHMEDNVFPYIGLNAVAGKEPKDYGLEPLRFDDMIPGCYDPVERVKDMDLDGVQAACCFPSFPGFGGRVFHRAKDRDLALACVRAWNDFSIEEWCASAPERYVPLALIPMWDIDLVVAEVRRVAAMGARTISFPDSPVPLGLPSFHSDYWGPLWDLCEDTGIAVSLHFGSGSFVPGFSASASALAPNAGGSAYQSVSVRYNTEPGEAPKDEAPTAVSFVLYSTNLMWSTADLALSGQLQKHPRLKFMLSEGGIGWLPYIAERADAVWERHRYYQPIDFDTRPSELIKKHFWGCYITDEFGIKNRHEIGVDRICVEVDYPHSDSLWPNSRKVIAESLADVPDDEAHRIVELNAREVLNFPRV
ncbi:putative TIM-barrel fold metal-dependent hydrolase [Actinocorallia herbida]|uniref:Putative TIM-barrel fold metal-dependent hydrolase n=1 Tax=Actinocorallia herbida TaxID=58109 RepID=A0A3N1D1S8_9ACTN|nr:amidohydrolase family protein [Actinocorallia herbida]ROO87475.1 putative TIM-barrel fold metal-dependent hydrolase [Actinocorallia herbida]